MRSNLREAQFYIARRPRAYLFSERITLKTRIVPHSNIETGRQRLDTGPKRVPYRFEVFRPRLDHELSRLDHAIRPRVERLRISASQKRIALTQYPHIASQHINVVVFHVKRAPIQPLTPPLWRPEDEIREMVEIFDKTLTYAETELSN